MEIFDYLSQMFLSRYFLFDSVCGNFLAEEERHRVFFEMAKIFCLSDDKRIRELFEETEAEHFRTITDFSSYERFCRLLEFAEKSSQPVRLSPSEKKILAQKRAALNSRQKIFGAEIALTEEDIYSTLLSKAMNGNVDSMTILAFMELHGICIFRDSENAIKRIRLCASWNNIFGLLMGILYDSDNKEEYYNCLYTILNNENRKQIFRYICDTCDFHGPFTKDNEARVLERAFELSVADRNVYDSKFATVVFSEMISVEDKKKLLLDSARGSLEACSNIPFDAVQNGAFTVNEKAASEFSLRRTNETEKIINNLRLYERGPASICSPLFIVAPDMFFAEMYSEMITAVLGDTPVIELDAATFDAYSLAPIKENVIFRGLSETKNARTVFIIKNCEELEDGILDDLQNLLDYNYRKKFPLNTPSIAVDISQLVLILFSGSRDCEAMKLVAECDTVYVEKINRDEKKTVIKALFENRKNEFGTTKASLSEDSIAQLLEADPGKLQKIIDGVLRKVIFGKNPVITAEDISTVCKEQNIVNTKNGFGYVGGDVYA